MCGVAVQVVSAVPTFMKFTAERGNHRQALREYEENI